MTCGIYKLTSPSGKSYIGQSRCIERRFREHKRTTSAGAKLRYAMKKYGPDNFTYEIIEECDIMMLNKKEFEYIEKFNTVKQGYNYGMANFRFTDEWKRSLQNRNYHGSNNPFFGKKHSKNAREKIKAARKRQVITDETKTKLSIAHKNRVFSKSHSKHKSEAQMGGRNPYAKRVLVNGVKYDTIRNASDTLGIKYSTVAYRLNSESFQEYQYITQQPGS